MPGFGFRARKQVRENQEHEGPKTEPSQNPKNAKNKISQYTQNPGVNLKDGNKLMISQVKSRVEIRIETWEMSLGGHHK